MPKDELQGNPGQDSAAAQAQPGAVSDEQRAANARVDPEQSLGGMGTAAGMPGGGSPEMSPANAPRATRPARRRNKQDEPKTIWVVASNEDNRVAIWERDPLHPGPDGDIMVSGDGRAVEVAPTPAVALAVREGRLIELDADEAADINDELDEKARKARLTEMARLRGQAELNRLEVQGGASAVG